jgi:hypothetical protein
VALSEFTRHSIGHTQHSRTQLPYETSWRLSGFQQFPSQVLAFRHGTPLALARIRDSARNPSVLATVAGSRAEKGVSLIVPNLLKYDGSSLAIDPKGELAKITARATWLRHKRQTTETWLRHEPRSPQLGGAIKM